MNIDTFLKVISLIGLGLFIGINLNQGLIKSKESLIESQENYIEALESENNTKNQMISIIKLILKFGNFDLLDRIAIKDKETGKEYR